MESSQHLSVLETRRGSESKHWRRLEELEILSTNSPRALPASYSQPLADPFATTGCLCAVSLFVAPSSALPLSCRNPSPKQSCQPGPARSDPRLGAESRGVPPEGRSHHPRPTTHLCPLQGASSKLTPVLLSLPCLTSTLALLQCKDQPKHPLTLPGAPNSAWPPPDPDLLLLLSSRPWGTRAGVVRGSICLHQRRRAPSWTLVPSERILECLWAKFCKDQGPLSLSGVPFCPSKHRAPWIPSAQWRERLSHNEKALGELGRLRVAGGGAA